MIEFVPFQIAPTVGEVTVTSQAALAKPTSIKNAISIEKTFIKLLFILFKPPNI